MPTAVPHIALLRAFSFSGDHRLKSMADLKAKLEKLGYRNVRTYIATGNILFDAVPGDIPAMEAKMEAELLKAFAIKEPLMIRTAREWSAILDRNPLKEEAKSEPSRLLVIAYKTPPASEGIEKVRARHKGPERIEVIGNEAFVFYPVGIGTSKLNLNPLGSGTARNWNTAVKLKALADAG